MNCYRPIFIPNPDANKDIEDYARIAVPCGRCPACVVSQSHEWRVRLEEELSNSFSAYFITLTYDDDSVPIEKCSDSDGNEYFARVVSKRDVQLFLKRLRKRFPGEEIRYFLVSEYGPTTFRPHYHGIFFNLPLLSNNCENQRALLLREILQVWNRGSVTIDNVTLGRVNYVTKYLSCITDLPSYLPKPFRLMSRRPGIGYQYMERKDRVEWHRKNLACYIPSGRFKRRMPRYFKDKIFDDSMKIDIKEQIKNSQNEQVTKDIILAGNYNYSCYESYILDKRQKFERNFERKFKKNRKL